MAERRAPDGGPDPDRSAAEPPPERTAATLPDDDRRRSLLAASALPRSFYDRPVVDVARDLLGCTVICGDAAGRIVETEAYHESEAACHGYGTPPRPTLRTATLFGPPGHAYVYRSYGIHAMLNAVCEPAGIGAAVLIRAVDPVLGIDLMRARRAGRRDVELTNGPGKLAQALAIALDRDGDDLTGGDLRIVGREHAPHPVVAAAGVRIGITRAVDLAWRFADASSPYVSRPRLAPPGGEEHRRGAGPTSRGR